MINTLETNRPPDGNNKQVSLVNISPPFFLFGYLVLYYISSGSVSPGVSLIAQWTQGPTWGQRERLSRATSSGWMSEEGGAFSSTEDTEINKGILTRNVTCNAGLWSTEGAKVLSKQWMGTISPDLCVAT